MENPPPSGRRRLQLAALIAFAVVLLDQAAKIWADRVLSGAPPLTVLENFFHLTYHRNSGGVFGLFAGPAGPARRIIFIALSLAALGLIIYLLLEWGRSSLPALIALALVCGGAVGNLIDRIAYGEVIDFIDWHWYTRHWPTFNIADSAITVGTILLVATVIFSPSRLENTGP